MRAGVHWGRPRKLGGDYLGVDVNVAARVAGAAKADQVLVSDVLLARIELDGLHSGRAKRLRADGAPRELQVAPRLAAVTGVGGARLPACCRFSCSSAPPGPA